MRSLTLSALLMLSIFTEHPKLFAFFTCMYSGTWQRLSSYGS
jgi:hypothetical protein